MGPPPQKRGGGQDERHDVELVDEVDPEDVPENDSSYVFYRDDEERR